MITRRKFIAGCSVVPFLSYLSLESAFAATPPSILVMAMRLDNVTSLDPHESFEAVGHEIIGNLYQMLVRPNLAQPDIIEGDLAESWQVSEDNKRFTFFLHKNAKFSDGSAVTADDVAFSFHRLIRLNKGPAFIINQFGYTADNIEQHAVAVDANTFVLTTENPVSESLLFYCLANTVASVLQKSKVLANQNGDDLGNAWLRQNSAGSGMFKLQSWNASESVILNANEHSTYSGKIKRVILRHIADPSAQLLMLEKGDVDVARDLTSEQIKPLIGNSDYNLVRKEISAITLLSCNVAYGPLAKPQVWQAIRWALDYQGIQQNIVPLTHQIHQSFLPKGFPGSVTDIIYSKDSAKAKELLAQAGYPDGFAVTIDHYAAQPSPDIAQAIQANLGEIGIKVSLLAGENRQVLTKMRARQHQMALTSWGADYFDPNANAEAFCVNTDNSENARSRTLAWRCNWQDESMNVLADKALQEIDPKTRLALYEELQRNHMQNSPFTIMLQQTRTAACRKNITGVDMSALNDSPYDKVVKS